MKNECQISPKPLQWTPTAHLLKAAMCCFQARQKDKTEGSLESERIFSLLKFNVPSFWCLVLYTAFQKFIAPSMSEFLFLFLPIFLTAHTWKIIDQKRQISFHAVSIIINFIILAISTAWVIVLKIVSQSLYSKLQHKHLLAPEHFLMVKDLLSSVLLYLPFYCLPPTPRRETKAWARV